MDIRDFSLRLAKLRTQKGLSAREMSLQMGQNPGYINNIETGKSLPSLSGILYICEFLEVSPHEFFDFDANCPTKLRTILEDLKHLDDVQLDAIAVLVKCLRK